MLGQQDEVESQERGKRRLEALGRLLQVQQQLGHLWKCLGVHNRPNALEKGLYSTGQASGWVLELELELEAQEVRLDAFWDVLELLEVLGQVLERQGVFLAQENVLARDLDAHRHLWRLQEGL